jgi:dephospho-CoA kinase
MKVVGLTGGIGTGKSTVSKMIEEIGIPVIDADKISKAIVEKRSPILKKIVEEFGIEVINPDGTLNRKKLGKIVFENAEKREKLNSIMHPAVKRKIVEEISALKKAGNKICVIDVPLLIESGFTDLVHKLIVVYANESIQVKRIIERDNLTEDEAMKRIKSQMPFEEKRKYADYILDNSKSMEFTKEQLINILRDIMMLEDLNEGI